MEQQRKCFKCGCTPAKDNVKLFRFPKPGVTNLIRCLIWAKYIFPENEKQYASIDFQKKLHNEHRMLCQRHFKDSDFADNSKTKLLRTAVPCNGEPALRVYSSAGLSQQRPFSNISSLQNVEAAPQQAKDKSVTGPSTSFYAAHQAKENIEPVAGPSRYAQQVKQNVQLLAGPSKENVQPLAGPSRYAQHAKQNVQPLAGPSKENVLPLDGPSTAAPTAPSQAQQTRENILLGKCHKYMKKVCQLRNRLNHIKRKDLIKAVSGDSAVKKLSKKITPAFALLLQGQIRNFKRKSTGRRWSKEEKITALRIYKRSPTCYRLLRRLFPLPSTSTLKTLLRRLPFKVGVNQPIFTVLKRFAVTQAPNDNYYILMFDEMSLKKHFQYNPKDDIIEGYQDHGNQGRSPVVAAYALVFMIAGIRKRFKQPVAHYFSSGFSTADRLAVLIKEVLYQCFEAGINVVGTVCDMDGVNRRALTILGSKLEHPVIKVHDKEIVTFFDTPHLLKCFRNMFIKYNIEMTTNISSDGKVGKGDIGAEATVTANLVADMDKLFDLVNADTSDLRRGKPHSTNWSTTSPHKAFLAKMKKFFQTMRFIGSPRKPPSQEGWIITINAFHELRKKMEASNITSLATRRLQQDPLENLFGCIRGNCGSNTTPTCGQFVAGLKTAILGNLSHIGTSGNCETDNNTIINNFKTFLSVSQPAHTSTDTGILIDEFPEVREEQIQEENAEIQACAYVCGFIVKKNKNKCQTCQNIFLSEITEPQHLFVECREYNELKKNLNYVTKAMIACVESSATLTNKILKEKGHTNFLKKTISQNLNTKINFEFLNKCPEHKETNVEHLINSVFMICIKRFCILKNRSFTQEASEAALKRKMKMITHQ